MSWWFLLFVSATQKVGFKLHPPSIQPSGWSWNFIHPRHPSKSSPHLLHPKGAAALPSSDSRPIAVIRKQIQLRRRPPLPVIPAICMPSCNFCSICSGIWKVSTEKWVSSGVPARGKQGSLRGGETLDLFPHYSFSSSRNRFSLVSWWFTFRKLLGCLWCPCYREDFRKGIGHRGFLSGEGERCSWLVSDHIATWLLVAADFPLTFPCLHVISARLVAEPANFPRKIGPKCRHTRQKQGSGGLSASSLPFILLSRSRGPDFVFVPPILMLVSDVLVAVRICEGK